MRITEGRIRQIIREEARRALRESDSGVDFKIQEFEWDDLHNDGGARTQGGELTVMFSAGDMTDMKATKYITSYVMSEKSLLEDLTYEINSTLEQNELESVDEETVKAALGDKLNQIMSELERSEKIYQDDAAASEGGDGDFYESKRIIGRLVREALDSRFRKI